MSADRPREPRRVRVPVRSGPYQYLLVGPDGESSTIPVDGWARDAGWAHVDVGPDDRVIEIALKSTSDPDTDPPRGQLWPDERGTAPAPPDLTTMLFVPAARPRMIDKARALDAAAVIVDLEDGTGIGEKDLGRATVVEALAGGWSGRPTLFVRVNGPETELFDADLRAVAPLDVFGVCIPKCESATDVRRAEDALVRGGAGAGVRLLPFVESPLGIVNAYAIASASARVVGVALGSEDLAASMGLVRTSKGGELVYFRSAVATAAQAVGAVPIDAVFIDFNDPVGLERDARAGRALGFGGKQIIHPAQIEPVTRAYAPSPDEVARARRVVEAFDAAERRGEGVVVVDGRMIDRPVVLQARRTLARAGR
jgi:citrate lyase subunit beta/citryl-CoA lyase